MHVLNTRQYFLDTLVELTGIKSGLAVSVPKAVDLLDKRTKDTNPFWRGNPIEGIRLEIGVVQKAFVKLLHCVGGIGDSKGAGLLVKEFVQRNQNKLRPLSKDELEEYGPYDTPEFAAFYDLQTMLSGHQADPTPLISGLVSLPEWKEVAIQCELRMINKTQIPESKKWDGAIDLRDLFKSEDAPSFPETYFDQRFIDYLWAQGEDLTEIHWRQFERLTAEYFKREGYRVTLGPGRADGGIDIHAAKDRIFAGPKIIIIQCKRIKSGNKVVINDVKALYCDVLEMGAAKGIIATTTRLATNGREYCDARKHRLERAEGQTVLNWVREMSSHVR